MRKKDKPQSTAQQVVNDEQEVCQDFRCQRRHWSLTVSPYKNLEGFENLKGELDAAFSNIVSGKPVLDEGNENVLDTLIADMTRKNIIYLKKQAVERMVTIKGIHAQAQAEKLSYELHLKYVEGEYEKLKEKYEKLNDYYNKSNYKCMGGDRS